MLFVVSEEHSFNTCRDTLKVGLSICSYINVVYTVQWTVRQLKHLKLKHNTCSNNAVV